MPLRFSIRGLSAIVLFLGFGFGALRGATIGWVAASILLAVLVLCVTTLGALVRRGPSRPAWVGFALFGWVYFLLHFGPWADWKRGFGPAHFTTWAIDALLLPRLAPELQEGTTAAGFEGYVKVKSGRSGSLVCAVSHALGSLLFGCVGSLSGFLLAARRDGSSRGTPPAIG
jgi:hypothetical protein